MKFSFSIIGCCVCRDVFRLNPCDEFVVDKFIQTVSPIAMVDKNKDAHILDISDLSSFTWSNFQKRNLCFNFNGHEAEQHLCKDGLSDFLILDLCELRFPHAMLEFPNNKKSIVTKTRLIEELLNDNNIPNKLKGTKLQDIEFSDQEVFSYLDDYINLILKYYSPSQIILYKNFPVNKHLDDEQNMFYTYSKNIIFELNKRLNRYYNYFINKLPNIFVVEMPQGTLGWVQHLWGKDNLHFVDDYYQYLFKATQIIVSQANDKKRQLKELCDLFSKYFKLLEKEKRLEYFFNRNLPPSFLLNSTLESDKLTNNIVHDWNFILSENSSFNQETHLLTCGNKEKSWAILSQSLDKSFLEGKTITLSVKYKTLNNSKLNICIRGKIEDKLSFLISHIVTGETLDIDFLVYTFPNNLNKYKNIEIAIYLNHPNDQAYVYETKLEYGNLSTLF